MKMNYQAVRDENAEDADKPEETPPTPPAVRFNYPPAVSFNYMYTPYSDITEQEEFASEYRRKIVLLYFTFLPLTILVSAVIARYMFDYVLVSKILLFCAIGVLCVGVPYFTFFGFFTVVDFLALPIWFYLWPLIPLLVGTMAVLITTKKDSAFGMVLMIVSVWVVVTNELAREVSWWTEEERLRQWPPLPGTDALDHL